MVGFLLWWGGKIGTLAVVGALFGIPTLLIGLFVVFVWLFVETPEQRREYLREKRRRMRATKEAENELAPECGALQVEL